MTTTPDTILVIGACGQLGSELTLELRKIYGNAHVVAADIQFPKQADLRESGPFEIVDVLTPQHLSELASRYKFTQIYHLAAILSATGEMNPKFAWRLNMDGLFNVLDFALEQGVKKVYWPSSIAVFGPNTPRQNTPQYTVMDPNTVYGISKQAGERWCNYYFNKYGLDVRSIRYPGLIGYKALPGGGTTDYAVDIFHQALAKGTYKCFLSAHTRLPMMYMPDAIKATLDLMHAPAEQIQERSSYNLAAMSFTPHEIAESLQRHFPDFTITYAPDARQQIADSWPQTIDDSVARQHWGWSPSYDLHSMTDDMLRHLRRINN